MERTCLKCGFVNPEASPTNLAACPKCGAIYSRVEAHVAKTGVNPLEASAEAKARAQFQPSTPVHPPRLPPIAKPVFVAAPARRKWFTPGFALMIFVGYALLVGLPLLIAAFIARENEGMAMMFLIAGVLLVGIGAVALELVLVVFHMSATLEDLREEMRANRTDRG